MILIHVSQIIKLFADWEFIEVSGEMMLNVFMNAFGNDDKYYPIIIFSML